MLSHIFRLNIVIFLLIFSKLAMAQTYEKAILAGGCFWGMEQLISELDGVISTNVGYTGGNIKNPTYEIVSTSITNHAEAIEIIFDPAKISYEELLKFFFTIHDPTTLNRQQNDIGSQYRSAIFYLNNSQKNIAHNVINQGNASGVFKKPIVTEISPAQTFYILTRSLNT